MCASAFGVEEEAERKEGGEKDDKDGARGDARTRAATTKASLYEATSSQWYHVHVRVLRTTGWFSQC